MNKRAEWTLLQTGTILGGIMVAFLIIFIVLRVTSQTSAEASFLAKDTSLLVDSMLGVPGEIQIGYPHEFTIGRLTNAYLVLNKSSLSVYLSEPKPNSTSMHKYYFVPREDVKIIDEQIIISTLYFVKDQNLSVSNTPLKKEVK